MRFYTFFSLLIFLSAISCQEKAEPRDTQKTESETPIPVETVAVTRIESGTTIHATGVLASETETRLSFKTGGIIQLMRAEQGDIVERGALLAQLNLTEIEAQVTQADFAVQKAERDLERVQNLYRDTAATLEQVQNLQTALDVARKNLEIARFNLDFSAIRAPHRGVIVQKIASEGELTAPGMPVYLLAGTGAGQWIARVSVSDKDRVLLREGDVAGLFFDAFPDREFAGSIQKIAPVADPMNSLFRVELRIPTPDKRFSPGQFVRAEIQPRAAIAQTAIPIEAIVEGNGKEAFVYVPTADGKHVEKLPVSISELTPTHAVISKGLEGIDRVITAGSPYLSVHSTILIK